MGKLYGIGVGPGDPELLTLKAYKILQKADVIFCPEKKKGAGSFAFDIIKEHIKTAKPGSWIWNIPCIIMGIN